MNTSNKYQPYRGYGRKPWLGYTSLYCGRRVRTQGDWHYDLHPWRSQPDKPRRFPFWRRFATDNTSGSVYEKHLAHRTFRRQAKDAIRRELLQQCAKVEYPDISHDFRYYGNWLD